MYIGFSAKNDFQNQGSLWGIFYLGRVDEGPGVSETPM